MHISREVTVYYTVTGTCGRITVGTSHMDEDCDNRCYLTWDEVQYIFLNNKCGHRNVLSKRQVWMSIFHIINLKKKKNHGLRVQD